MSISNKWMFGLLFFQFFVSFPCEVFKVFGVKELGLPKTFPNSNPTGTSHPDKVFIVLQKKTISIEYMKVFHFMASLFKSFLSVVDYY